MHMSSFISFECVADPHTTRTELPEALSSGNAAQALYAWYKLDQESFKREVARIVRIVHESMLTPPARILYEANVRELEQSHHTADEITEIPTERYYNALHAIAVLQELDNRATRRA